MTSETKETLSEEPSVAEIADACREVLDPKTCDEISAQESTGDAFGLAFTALTEAGEEAEAFLKREGILE